MKTLDFCNLPKTVYLTWETTIVLLASNITMEKNSGEIIEK